MKTILFVSPGQGEGRTTALVNVALNMMEKGKKILLVDENWQRPVLHQIFGTPSCPGLLDMLEEDGKWNVAPYKTDRPNLYVLPAGKVVTSLAEIMNLSRLDSLILHLKEQFDLILFDSPPLLVSADVIPLASKMDGVCLIARAGVTPVKSLQESKRQLEAIQPPKNRHRSLKNGAISSGLMV